MLKLNVFLASPQELNEERSRALDVIRSVETAYRPHVEIAPIWWKARPLEATAGYQEQIDPLLEQADVVLFLMWWRLGSPLEARYDDHGRRRTGSEWEFERALELHAARGRPAILVYRRTSLVDRPEPGAPKDEVDRCYEGFRQVDRFFERNFPPGPRGVPSKAYFPYERPEEFAELLRTHLGALVKARLDESQRPASVINDNPFVGLSSFTEEKAPLFFGRARAVNDVRRLLRQQAAQGRSFVLVLGASGAGKSSLARAGVLPAIQFVTDVQPEAETEGIAGRRGVRVLRATMRPAEGETVFEALAAAIRAIPEVTATIRSESTLKALGQRIQGGNDAFLSFVDEVLKGARTLDDSGASIGDGGAGHLLLLVDQLEELYTADQIAVAARERFIELLDALARSGRGSVIATLRSDFYGRLAELPVLLALKGESGAYDLLPPGPEEIREIVAGPARMAGMFYEQPNEAHDRSLEDRIVDHAQRNPIDLPLVQYTLDSLYVAERGVLGRHPGILHHAKYDDLGGIEGALEKRAEDCYAGLARPEGEDSTFTRLVLLLSDVDLADDRPVTRRWVPAAEIDSDPGLRAMVDWFVAGRLLVWAGKDGRGVLAVAHEKLMTAWTRMALVIGSRRDLLQLRSRFERDAKAWNEDPASGRLVTQASRLQDAERLLSAPELSLDDGVRRFLGESLAVARRKVLGRRLRRTGLVVAVIGAWALWSHLDQRSFERDLSDAREYTAAERLDDARAALRRAADRRPGDASVEAVDDLVRAQIERIRERQHTDGLRAEVVKARGEASEAEAESGRLRRDLAELESSIATRREATISAFAPPDVRAGLAKAETDIREIEMRLDQLVSKARESLERASRIEEGLGGVGAETRAAMAVYWVSRWREAYSTGDATAARLASAKLEEVDAERYRGEVHGRVPVRILTDPPGALLHLFVYEPAESLGSGVAVIPRLVPVPTAGAGRLHAQGWGGGLLPGERCLVVTAVEADSPWSRDLDVGDFVVRVGRSRCPGGLSLAPEAVDMPSSAEEPFVLLQAIDGVPVDSVADVDVLRRPRTAAPESTLTIGTARGTVERRMMRGDALRLLDAPSTRLIPVADQIAALVAPSPGVHVEVLHGGEIRRLLLPAGAKAGIRLDATAYPLILASGNRLAASDEGRPIEIEPGSYLLLAEAPLREPQRLPFVVEPGQPARLTVSLWPHGTSPPGFVYVPPIRFVYGGDSAALESATREIVRVPDDPAPREGFWIARSELTYGEWFEFINEPETLAKIRAARAGSADGTVPFVPFLPRDQSKPQGFAIDAGAAGFRPDAAPGVAVLGISWNDAMAYVAYRNRRSEREGSSWRFDLPSQREWECAARGADGRQFPWGGRFDYSLCVSGYYRPFEVRFVPPGTCLEDESPFGLRDVAGSRWEWCRDPSSTGSGMYPLRGGAWQRQVEAYFRCASRGWLLPTESRTLGGVRLVARRRG